MNQVINFNLIRNSTRLRGYLCMVKKSFIAVSLGRGFLVAAIAVCGFFIATPAFAAVSITKATGISAISAATNGTDGTGDYAAATGPTITESATGEIGAGTLTLVFPSSFELNTDGAVSFLVTKVSGDGDDSDNINDLASGSTIDADFVDISSGNQSTYGVGPKGIAVTVTSATGGNTVNSLTLQGLEVRPVAGTPLGTGCIKKLPGGMAITGVTAATAACTDSKANLGDIASVAGVPATAVLSASNTSISAVGGSVTITIGTIKDAGGNAVTSGSSLALATSAGTVNGCTAISGGTETCTLSMPIGGIATGTATLSISGITITGDTDISIVAGSISTLAIAASPTSLAYDQTSTVTVTGKDIFGNTNTTDDATTVTLLINGPGVLEDDEGNQIGYVTMTDGVGTAVLSATGTGRVSVTTSSGFPAVSVNVNFTETDTSAPTIDSTTPAVDSTDVAVNESISITFSEALKDTTVSSRTIQLKKYDDDSAVTASVYLGEGGSKVFIVPVLPLDYDMQYYFAVSTGVTDLVGNALETALDDSTKDDYSFTTEEDSTVLAVTQIALTRATATADDSFDSGWEWVFSLTVPSDQTSLAFSFGDWSNIDGVNSIAAADNIRYYTSQSSDAGTRSAARTITTRDSYATDITLSGDLDTHTAGRQIRLYVETKIPVDAVAGSYYTRYNIRSR